jgi:hypothetical protein
MTDAADKHASARIVPFTSKEKAPRVALTTVRAAARTRCRLVDV